MPAHNPPKVTMTTDIVIFTIRDERLELLLIQRGNPPFQGSWALPGGIARGGRGPRRLRPPRAGGGDGRRGPGARAIPRLRGAGPRPARPIRHRRLPHAGPARSPQPEGGLGRGERPLVPGRRPAPAGVRSWRDHRDGPPSAAMPARGVGGSVRLPARTFTLDELRRLHEVVRGERLDARRFRSWALAAGVIEETGETRSAGRHPARLYRAIDRDVPVRAARRVAEKHPPCHRAVRRLDSYLEHPVASPSAVRIAMLNPSSGRAKRRFAGASCVLLAACCFAPSPALASCGHGVTSEAGRRSERDLSHLESLVDHMAAPVDSGPAVPGREPVCSGPTCSRRQGLPPVSAPVSPVTSDSWCIMVIVPQWQGPDPTGELADLSSPHPRQSTSPIERPPRMDD